MARGLFPKEWLIYAIFRGLMIQEKVRKSQYLCGLFCFFDALQNHVPRVQVLLPLPHTILRNGLFKPFLRLFLFFLNPFLTRFAHFSNTFLTHFCASKSFSSIAVGFF